MKKLFGIMMFIFVIIAAFAYADTEVMETVVSDTTNTYDGSNPAVATFVHSSWPSIPGATWIWTCFLVDAESKFGPYTFKKTFSIPNDAHSIGGSIMITADNAYKVYLNGVLLGSDGTVSSPPPTHDQEPNHVAQWSSIETYNFVPQPGANEITIQANNYRGWVDPNTNPAGVLYRAVFVYKVPEPTNDVPEFGTIGAAFALAGAGAYLYRKRK